MQSHLQPNPRRDSAVTTATPSVTRGWIVSADGTRLSYRRYEAKGRVRGTVAIVHGHGEHQDRYRWHAEAFNAAGFTVHTVDLRGHGRSGGWRGHAASYDLLLDDVEALLAQVDTDEPVFLWGHSMGGNIVINYVLRRPSHLAGLIVTGAFLRLGFEPPKWKTTLGEMFANVWPDFAQPTGLKIEEVSRDPEVQIRYAGDPLVHDRITARLYKDLVDTGRQAIERAGEIKVPLLLIHGADDKLTSPDGSRAFGDRVGSGDKTVELWPRLLHEVHNEIEKNDVIRKMTDWITKRAK